MTYVFLAQSACTGAMKQHVSHQDAVKLTTTCQWKANIIIAQGKRKSKANTATN